MVAKLDSSLVDYQAVKTEESYKQYKESFLIQNIQIKEIEKVEEEFSEAKVEQKSEAPSVNVINLAGNLGKGLM